MWGRVSYGGSRGRVCRHHGPVWCCAGATGATGANEAASARLPSRHLPSTRSDVYRSLSPGIQNNFYDQAQRWASRGRIRVVAGWRSACTCGAHHQRTREVSEQASSHFMRSEGIAQPNLLMSHSRTISPATRQSGRPSDGGTRRLRSAPEIFFTGLKNLRKDPLGWLSIAMRPSLQSRQRRGDGRRAAGTGSANRWSRPYPRRCGSGALS